MLFHYTILYRKLRRKTPSKDAPFYILSPHSCSKVLSCLTLNGNLLNFKSMANCLVVALFFSSALVNSWVWNHSLHRCLNKSVYKHATRGHLLPQHRGHLCSPYPSYSTYLYGTSYNEIRACESVNNLLCYTLLSLIRVRTNSEEKNTFRRVFCSKSCAIILNWNALCNISKNYPIKLKLFIGSPSLFALFKRPPWHQ